MDSGCLWQLQAGKALEVGIQHRPPKRNVRIPALAPHLDQAGLAKFLQMMRYGRGAEDIVFLQQTASHAIIRRYLLQHGESVRIGQSTRDGLELFIQ